MLRIPGMPVSFKTTHSTFYSCDLADIILYSVCDQKLVLLIGTQP